MTNIKEYADRLSRAVEHMGSLVQGEIYALHYGERPEDTVKQAAQKLEKLLREMPDRDWSSTDDSYERIAKHGYKTHRAEILEILGVEDA